MDNLYAFPWFPWNFRSDILTSPSTMAIIPLLSLKTTKPSQSIFQTPKLPSCPRPLHRLKLFQQHLQMARLDLQMTLFLVIRLCTYSLT